MIKNPILEITLAKDTTGGHQTKRWGVKEGVVRKLGAQNALTWDFRSESIRTLSDLEKLLSTVDSSTIALPRCGLSTMVDYSQPQNRRLQDSPLGGGHLQRVPSRLICIDIDQHQAPPGFDPAGDPDGAAATIADWVKRATGMGDADVLVQFSASMCAPAEGAPPPTSPVAPTLIKAHVWFINDQPLDEAMVRGYFQLWNEQGQIRVDEAMASAAQVHYVANPIYHAPLQDPLPTRWVLIQGTKRFASLPAMVIARTSFAGQSVRSRRQTDTENARPFALARDNDLVTLQAMMGSAHGCRTIVFAMVIKIVQSQNGKWDSAACMTEVCSLCPPSMAYTRGSTYKRGHHLQYLTKLHLGDLVQWVIAAEKKSLKERLGKRAAARLQAKPAIRPSQTVSIQEATDQVRAACRSLLADVIASLESEENAGV